MSEESWDTTNEANSMKIEEPKKTEKRLTGVGRGKPKLDLNTDESPPPPAKTNIWGRSNDAPPGFSNNSSGNGGFGDRRERGGGHFGNSSSGPRQCYNCQQTGHLSRECPQPRQENRNNRGGGFNSVTRRGENEQNRERSGFGNGSTGNTTGGFRGSRGASNGGGFSSGDNRNNTNTWASANRQPRDEAGKIFSSGAGRTDHSSNPNVGDEGPRVERYIPPPVPTKEEDIFGEALSKGENFEKYHRANVKCTPEGKVQSIDCYEEASLPTQVLSNIRRAHFEEPTPIQRYTIPCIRQQDDLVACAQTGSGKTAAFLLPIISNLLEYHADELPQKFQPPAPLCLVVSPTRELALQTEREARKFAFDTPVIPCSAIGGHDMFAVSDRLKEGCHILSATTGRLMDMVEKGRLSLKHIKYFVLDEADRMLDQDFERDIRKLQELGLPSKEQRYTSMFSATFPAPIQRLAKEFLRENYVFLTVGTPGGANEDIAQTIEEVPQSDKKNRLLQLLDENLKTERCLIFVETKRSADYIGSLLSQKQKMSTTMHGDRTQKQRYEAVQDFANGRCPILVATSVAARGLDFPLIGYVINYDLPDTSDFYIHRIGRTGRAGHLGKSISFFDPQRESDRRIAPELIARLIEAGQEVPSFLKQYENSGSNTNSSNSQTTDMRHQRSDIQSRNHFSARPTGGTSSAGAARDEAPWD